MKIDLILVRTQQKGHRFNTKSVLLRWPVFISTTEVSGGQPQWYFGTCLNHSTRLSYWGARLFALSVSFLVKKNMAEVLSIVLCLKLCCAIRFRPTILRYVHSLERRWKSGHDKNVSIAKRGHHPRVYRAMCCINSSLIPLVQCQVLFPKDQSSTHQASARVDENDWRQMPGMRTSALASLATNDYHSMYDGQNSHEWFSKSPTLR